MKKIYNELRRSKPHISPNPPMLAIQRASLESLPVELKLSILHNISDVISLNALVHASPLYHEVYSSQRQSLLSGILIRDIGEDVMIDAWTPIRASSIRQKEAEEDAREVSQLLEQYKARRKDTNSESHGLLLENLLPMTQLHNVVDTQIHRFCEWALSTSSSSGKSMKPHDPISSAEKRRLRRAFHRFEVFCRLFGELSPFAVSSFDVMDQSHKFLALFPSWEVEEIACVRDYIMWSYDELFKRFEKDLIDSWESDSDVEDYVVGNRLQHDGIFKPELRLVDS